MPTTRKGSWQIQESIHPMDDSVSISAVLPATEGKSDLDGPYLLVIRFQEKQLEIYVRWQESFIEISMSNEVNIEHRIPPNKPNIEKWHLSDDGGATFSSDPKELYEKMKTGERFIIRKDKKEMAVFDLTGIDEVNKRIENAILDISQEESKQQLKEQKEREKKEIDQQYIEARKNAYNGDPVPWYVPMQEIIDGFDYEIIVKADLVFDIELFKKLSIKVLSNPLDKSISMEYFNLYTSLVEKYNEIKSNS